MNKNENATTGKDIGEKEQSLASWELHLFPNHCSYAGRYFGAAN